MKPSRWITAAVLLAGCAPSTLSQTALQGDLPTLRTELVRAQRAGKLDRDETFELARAIATRELSASKGDEAVARVRELRSCLGQLVSEFEDRAEGKDAGAAAAALALLDAQRADKDDLFEEHRSADDPSWRAVAARAAVGRERGEYRRAAFLHGDLRVRRAALHAALESPTEDDLSSAIEASRLDPDPLVRSLGVRLVGSIGGRRAVDALRDLWPRAEAETRQGIVDAWALPTSYDRGGMDQVLWAMETQKGLPAVVAAARLSKEDSQHRAAGVATLGRTIDDGPVDEQRLAILLAPAASELVEPMKRVAAGDDAHAAVLAAAGLARMPAHVEFARTRLRELAKHQRVLISRQARAALVVMGDSEMVPLLQGELKSKSYERRRQAALDLLRLGRHASAATTLGDDVASVRTQTACAILTARARS